MTWFAPHVRPTQPGVYPVRVPNLDRQTWARWTGGHWCCWALSERQAAHCEWPGIRSGYEWQQPA